MKKFFFLIFLLFVACGPTEDDIQAKIDSSINSAVEKLEIKVDKLENKLDENNISSDNKIDKLNEDFENFKLKITNLLSENKFQIYTNSIKGNQPDVITSINQWNYILSAYCEDDDIAIGGFWDEASWEDGIIMKLQSFTTEDGNGFGVISSKEDLEQLTVYVYCLKN